MNARQTPAAPPVLIEVDDDIEAINRLYRERRWGDGLPVIPPTRERVERMLAGTQRAPDEVIARIAPGFGAATVHLIAVNAVLAGCEAQHLPVLIAATAAIAEQPLNLQGIQATTNPATALLIINGPIAATLELNSGLNCLGQGNWGNAVLGRALHLIMQNIGRALPGEMDRATQGQPGKFTFCCAENEAASPWPPLHVDKGFRPDQSTVTVVGASGTLNMLCHEKDAKDLLRVMADSIAYPTSNDYWCGGAPWVMLGPEHADIFAQAGMDKEHVRLQLWEQSKMKASRRSIKDYARTRDARAAELGDIGPDTLLPVSPTPADLGILVAGGPGTHSVYIPTFGNTRSVTRLIEP